MIPARLLLQSGEVFTGWSPYPCGASGEVVFNTGMVGYMECLTDPSYLGQILTFTYPLIGNYGVCESSAWESSVLQARAMVVSELAPFYDHRHAQYALLDFCKQHQFPVISGVDTRALTQCLRERGVVPGVIVVGDEEPLPFTDINADNLLAQVSVNAVHEEGETGPVLIVVDCGIKQNILRCLRQFPLRIKRVPFDYDFSEEAYDGVFISNGPGDPDQCTRTVAHVQQAMAQGKPVFGICLGAQLMALAAGGRTYKLPFGHRAQNQPVMELSTRCCLLTSQNHGFAIDAASLPAGWEVSHRSLNDNTVQGIRHKQRPFFAVQFHPEAAPGPIDTQDLFAKFYHMLLGQT